MGSERRGELGVTILEPCGRGLGAVEGVQLGLGVVLACSATEMRKSVQDVQVAPSSWTFTGWAWQGNAGLCRQGLSWVPFLLLYPGAHRHDPYVSYADLLSRRP